MKYIIKPLSITAIFCLIYSCQPKVDIHKLEQELLDLHQKTIDAHLNKDVSFFTQNISDDYMQVHEGEFLYPKKEDIRQMFTHYFNSTNFFVYEDIQKPIVRVADDGSIGWTIVQVRAKGEQEMENDSIKSLDYTFAWITMYERKENKWIRLGEVDNFKTGK